MNFIKVMICFCSVFCLNALAVKSSSDYTFVKSLYMKAQQDFVSQKYAEAKKALLKIRNIEDKTTDTVTLAHTFNLLGVIYQIERKYQTSFRNFQKAVDYASIGYDQTQKELNLVKYNLANMLYRLQFINDSYEILSEINLNTLNRVTLINFLRLKASIEEKMRFYPESISNLIYAANYIYAIDPIRAESTIAHAFDISKHLFVLNAKGELNILVNTLDSLNKKDYGYWPLKYIVAKGYAYIGKRSLALKEINEFLRQDKFTQLKVGAEKTIERFEKLKKVQPNKIGVVLPLSGRYAKFGRLSLNSMMLALKTLQSRSDNPIELVVRDSKGDGKIALKAFDELVFSENVIAIVGPLLQKYAIEIGQRAQEYGVPLFSLSQKSEMNLVGNYVFPFGLSPQQQVESLVEYCIENLKYKRFAILAPDNNAGKKYVDLFWQEVESRDGQIVNLETYRPKSTDFSEEIKKLTGLHHLDSRRIEIEELDRRKEIYAASLKTRGNLRQRLLRAYDPKPIVDFDAIFVPDGPVAIGQIAPTFALKGETDLIFLGINTWNTVETIKRAGKYLQNSLFVDAFHPKLNKSKIVNFLDSFSSSYDQLPGTIEAQAYDATNILMQTINRFQPHSREDFKNQVYNLNKFSGVSSPFIFQNNKVYRLPYLLTIQGKNIYRVESDSSSNKANASYVP